MLGAILLAGIVFWLVYYYYWLNMRILPNRGIVVITGASTGIGNVCAIYLDSVGFTVFAGVRQQCDVDKLEALFKVNGRSKVIFLDVTDSDLISKAVQQVAREIDRVKLGLVGLINNAGISYNGPLDALPELQLYDNFNVNVFGVLRTTNAFLPLLQKSGKLLNHQNYPQNKATVVHVGSIVGSISMPFSASYCMTKHALEAMSDAQRLELSELSGIRICLAKVGFVSSSLFEKHFKQANRNIPNANIHQKFLDTLPPLAKFMVAKAADPIIVAKALEHAFTCRQPKPRIYVGWDSKLSWILGIFPDLVWDFIFLTLTSLIAKFMKPNSA